MRRKMFFLLSTSIFLIPIMTDCSTSKNKVSDLRWQFKTDDTHMTIEVVNNRQVISELKNPGNGWNWTKIPTEMPLPAKVKIGITSYKLDWIYKDGWIDKSEGMKLTLRFVSMEPNLELLSVWQARKGDGPVENSMSVKNNADSNMTFLQSDVVSANIFVIADSIVTLWRFNKGRQLKSKGYDFDKTLVYKDIIHADTSISYYLSNNRFKNVPKEINTLLPFQVLDVNSRHGLYMGYEWSFGKFVDQTGYNPLEINYKAYLGDTSSVTKESGKYFNVPAVFFGTYTGDVDDGSNKMKRWFWKYKITPSLKNNMNEPLIEYCIPGNESQLIEYYQKYPMAEWGAELGKIDIEWLDGGFKEGDNRIWVKENLEKHAYWEPDTVKWPNGMTAGNIVHSNKQKLSLYMNNTFEWADIGTQEGRDKQKHALLTRYDNWHYDYWRSDFIVEAVNNYLSHEGLLEILDYMITNRPDFRYEHCAGGGLLKDFTTLQRITVFTNEDSGNPENHRKSFYSCSYMINPAQIKADIGMNSTPTGQLTADVAIIMDSPEWVKYVLRTGFMGANMATNWGIYTPNQIAGVKEHWPLYKSKQRPILRGAKPGDAAADIYHILPVPDGINWDGIEYFNTSLNKGSVLLFKPSDSAPDTKVIRFKGFDKKATYTLTFEDRKEQNTKKTGAELMDKGIEIKGMTGNFASEIIWIN